jgi:ribosome-associated protein
MRRNESNDLSRDLLAKLLSETWWRAVRSSGPGGQNVNKVSSKVELRWLPASSRALSHDVRERFLARYGGRLNREGELVVVSERFRDQRRNRDDCLEKLGEMVRAVLKPPKKRKKTAVPRSVQERRLAEKKRRGSRKEERRAPRL